MPGDGKFGRGEAGDHVHVCKWYDALRCVCIILTCFHQEGRHRYRDGEIMTRLG
jgi:hypothetical protein